ncbi:PR-1-like protein [Lophiostoma macrostomum CBS 122681]|uniref:PR-1-like protein n=1 Tax=Lophiostoma macrostomum CBS 122681 TaxID=1314788 RepID=A0A6A6T941_9PLEO|nr:PR-1-like protein [Lophiostoma macrostomum CBS 122681]
MHFSALTASLLVSGAAAHQGRWPPHFGWGHHGSSGVAPTGGFPTGGFPTGAFPTGAFPTGAFPTGGSGYPTGAPSVATSFKTVVVSIASTASVEGFHSHSRTAVVSKKTSAAVSIATSAPVTSAVVSKTSSAAATTTSASSGSGSLTSDEQAALDAHNAARAEVGTKDLVWDASLAADALAYAQTLASTGTFEHSGVEGQGENLYMQSNTDNPLLNAVNAFVSEKSEYDGGVITESNYSHYTQVVWKDTTNVGMASAKGSGGTYVVARYSPPGNYLGETAY